MSRCTPPAFHATRRSLRPIIAIAVSSFTLFVAACGGGSKTLNGSTKCSDFRSMTRTDQEQAVEAMAKARGDKAAIGIVRLSAMGYCALNPNKEIQGIYGGN